MTQKNREETLAKHSDVADRQSASKRIAELKKQADALITEATVIADKYGVEFQHSVLGVYGTGAYYYGAGEGEFESSDEYRRSDTEDGWLASSNSC